MTSKDPTEQRIEDYEVLDYTIDDVNLTLDLSQDPVTAVARLTLRPNPDYPHSHESLTLDGENMTLKRVVLDDKELTEADYVLTDHSLEIKKVPVDRSFTIEIKTELKENTDLFGLYKTGGIWIVKAESEGLRRVFYGKDRPDNLAIYTVTIIANADCPTLLSNGELVDEKDLGNGKHSATWKDPIPKPSYLFAMIAGDLRCKATQFITRSGRMLPIELYVTSDALNNCDYALEILKNAMAWDEQTYGLECELIKQMLTGVNKYAAGASEPPGLILFNTDYLIGTPATKTDFDFLRIAEVVAHEFLHYWSGDRVTIRDWFNLTLKEGLTSFRADEFLAHRFGKDIMRIQKGKTLEEGASRLSAYKFVRSLYVPAAYAKSAEIFGMLKTILGEDVFYGAVNYYFQTNKGKAVTLEDFVHSVAEYTHKDFQNFILWFTQPGIPKVTIRNSYDQRTHTYTLDVKQINSNPNLPYKPLPIPLRFGLLDKQGKELLDTTLLIEKDQQSFKFENISTPPVPSLFRNFSAPVYYEYNYQDEELLHLIRYDTDAFNRKEAIALYIKKWVDNYCSDEAHGLDPNFIATIKSLLLDANINDWILSALLDLPSENELIGQTDQPNIEKIHQARELIITNMASELRTEFETKLSVLETNIPTQANNVFDIQDAGKRRLKKTCMLYLSKLEPKQMTTIAVQQFDKALAVNMTNTINALEVLAQFNGEELKTALNKFYEQWKSDDSAINYWLKSQAAIPAETTVSLIRGLLDDPVFDISNPNKVYDLFRTFCANPSAFHVISGAGYQLLADVIIQLDKINPPIAAILLDPMRNWRKYDVTRKGLMKDQLVHMLQEVHSPAVLDVLQKYLADSAENKKSYSSWLNRFANWAIWKEKKPVSEQRDSPRIKLI